MFVIALILALPIGLSLGLLCGGGGMLMLPLLVYVLGVDPAEAAAASLFIVGITSAVALVPHARAGRLNLRVGIRVAGAGFLAAFVGGRVGSFVPRELLLTGFGLLMLGTASVLWRGRITQAAIARSNTRLLVAGLCVGFVSGLLGAGGGFLIVPALILVGGLTAPVAVGTSLLVVTVQAIAGFLGHASHALPDPVLVGALVCMTVTGTLIGTTLSPKLSPRTLRRAFAALVAGVALMVFSLELPWGATVVLIVGLSLALFQAQRRSGVAVHTSAAS